MSHRAGNIWKAGYEMRDPTWNTQSVARVPSLLVNYFQQNGQVGNTLKSLRDKVQLNVDKRVFTVI